MCVYDDDVNESVWESGKPLDTELTWDPLPLRILTAFWLHFIILQQYNTYRVKVPEMGISIIDSNL